MDDCIKIFGARHNNLKGFDLEIPLNKITVITGVSGAGKSSLAFDTLYAEGQRRYIETFSPYARQFMDRMDRPKADRIEGIPPALAIEQGDPVRTSRSTVGTVTEINDFMKMLFARGAELHCSGCGRTVKKHSPQSIFRELKCAVREGEPLAITATIYGSTVAALRAACLDRIWKEGRPADLDDFAGDVDAGCEVLFDRLPFKCAELKRIIDSLETALRWGKGRVDIHIPSGRLRFSSLLECPYCNISFREATPNLFSFNSPAGACPECSGFGRIIDIDRELIVPDPRKTIREGAVKPWTGIARVEFQDLIVFCNRKKIPVDVPFGELPEKHKEAIFEGDSRFYGIRGFFQWVETKRYKLHVRVFLARYRGYHTCPNCGGSRLVPEAMLWRIRGKSIADFYSAPIGQAYRCLKEINSHELDEAPSLLLSEISRRLGYLIDVGLGYLSLDRQSRTLSGGEMERVSLTKALGSSLVNTLYILDEPTVGLHPRDSQRLIGLLHRLRDQGNTIVVVEHDPEIIRAADNVIDLGPGAGENGGRLIYNGPVPGIAQGVKSKLSQTGSYLSGRLQIPVPDRRRTPSGFIKVKGASEHNLKEIDFKLPLGVMTALTGVSGSGKSTLAVETLYRRLKQIKGGDAPGAGRIKALDGHEQILDVALVDQEPIGRTPRATPATYLKALDGIRNLLTAQPLAQVRGYKSSYFSFNTAGGRCEECGGEGFEKVEMQFLSDIYLPCPKCDGKRFRDEVLEVKYQDRNIHEILGLTLNEAVEFFSHHPRITNPLAPVISVGLGYLRLGQPINTLSGGEAQRLKLARELGRVKQAGSKDRQATLFIFDEPTIGLHPADVTGLLAAFSQLVDSGNSILVIEHNPELIKCADHVVDLGPEGGAQGGTITGEGTPEEIAQLDSHTGKSIRPYLKKGIGPIAEKRETYGKTAPASSPATRIISINGAREHNLKDLDVDIPQEQLVVITGVSGSGKSTLAFDLLFAEGQRRYIESLSTYIRQYLKIMDRPEVDSLTGIPPTVALEQRMSRSGRRSTVATLTEIYHYLRLLYCKLGVQHCPECGDRITAHSAEGIAGEIMSRLRKGGKVLLLAPLITGKKGIHAELLKKMAKLGYKKAIIDGRLQDLEPVPGLSRFREHDINLVVDLISESRRAKDAGFTTALRAALDFGKGTVHIADEKMAITTYSEKLFCHKCGRGFEPLDPRLFSFNSRQGQCPRCEGIGSLEDFLPELILPDREKSITGNLELLQGRSLKRLAHKLLEEIENNAGIDPHQPLAKLSDSKRKGLLRGNGAGGSGFRGIIPLLREYREFAGDEEAENLESLLGKTFCPDCNGSRLRAEARSVRLKGYGIADIVSLPAAGALKLVGSFHFRGRDAEIADGIIRELVPRLKFLDQVGLGYLGLDRRGDTLSGGEAQRIRLAAQLGSNLRGICYILDEPTIGLHPRDNTMLISTLKELKERGNTILVVEHDDETIRNADHIIDLGPGAGPLGGRIIAQGTLREIKKNPDSITGRFLNSRRAVIGSRLRVNGDGNWLELRKASRHNLKGITVRIPLGTLTCVTGVSGSGKSTLIKEELFPVLKVALSGCPDNNMNHLIGWEGLTRAVEIDHSPIGRTPRSTPATYVGILDEIRKLFSLVPEARMRGYGPGRFSFNVKGGRCESCAGQGMIKVEMNFLPNVYIHCEECGGRRYNDETLDICYRGKNIHDVLAMSFREGLDLFSSISSLKKPLELLNDIGLGYLTFGQSSPSLSGGEAQRIKLAKELVWGNGRALYIMDEPTTGLHMADTERLLSVLQRLVDLGHTVVVIEHNLDIIRSADYIIDLGPEGGEAGGRIIAQGNPLEILKQAAKSHTAMFLKKHLGS